VLRGSVAEPLSCSDENLLGFVPVWLKDRVPTGTLAGTAGESDTLGVVRGVAIGRGTLGLGLAGCPGALSLSPGAKIGGRLD
jgi:hypothetical protein